MLKAHEDAYGHALLDHHHGRGGYEVDERDDGYVGIIGELSYYFAAFEDWPAHQRRAMRFVRGRVLDVGCGAGRWALHLQEAGHDVVAIDLSPRAVRTCRLRGVTDARVCSITQVGPALGVFDTILMMGNNFGLFASLRRARWLLRRFRRLTRPGARIVAESADPYQTQEPAHRRYHRRNRRRGRMGGQVRIRVRYRDYRTPWFDYLLASRQEVARILSGTGWRVRRFLDGRGPIYVAVIEKHPT
jgi:SAM-dependent methyltransferase